MQLHRSGVAGHVNRRTHAPGAAGHVKLPWQPSHNVAFSERVVARAGPGEAAPKKGKGRGPHIPPESAVVSEPPVAASAPAHRDEYVDLDKLEEEQGQQLAPYMDAVVKVYCVHTEPNYSLPWQRKRQYTSTSSGFIVREGDQTWLLTNAHSVDYHTQVKVKRRGDDRKFLARVLSIGVDCDIALLTVDDAAFWEGFNPLTFGELPRLQDGVAVVGYPIGGDTISVTAGVVSRIEVTDYSHGSTDLLAIQIDAAINGGNSGGPVFNKDCECVGIAFQALVGEDVENVGYVIPTPVVHHFLDDYRRTGTFTGFPALGIQWQRMESDALRRSYGMAPGQKGVLVRRVNPTSAAAATLRPDDIILRFDGTEISNDGTVAFRTGERIAFSYLITNKYVGDTARVVVLRGGKEVEVDVKLSKPQPMVPPHISNRDPSYLIVGGLVFTVCTEPYLQSEYGSDYTTESPVKLLDRMYYTFPNKEDEEVVVLAQVLASDATLGYEDMFNVPLSSFNGVPIRNLRQLAELVTTCTDSHMRFDLDYNEVVIVEAEAVRASNSEVLRSHSIPHTMSADLRAALELQQQQQPQQADQKQPASDVVSAATSTA